LTAASGQGLVRHCAISPLFERQGKYLSGFSATKTYLTLSCLRFSIELAPRTAHTNTPSPEVGSGTAIDGLDMGSKVSLSNTKKLPVLVGVGLNVTRRIPAVFSRPRKLEPQSDTFTLGIVTVSKRVPNSSKADRLIGLLPALVTSPPTRTMSEGKVNSTTEPKFMAK
jgi:hypothetical protein